MRRRRRSRLQDPRGNQVDLDGVAGRLDVRDGKLPFLLVPRGASHDLLLARGESKLLLVTLSLSTISLMLAADPVQTDREDCMTAPFTSLKETCGEIAGASSKTSRMETMPCYFCKSQIVYTTEEQQVFRPPNRVPDILC